MLRLSLVLMFVVAGSISLVGAAMAGGPEVPDPKLISTPATPIGETSDDFQWPLCAETGPGFGYLVDAFTGRARLHAGLDFSGDFGFAVLAIAPGRVAAAEKNGPYGLMVEIDHGRGYKSRYAQLQMTASSRATW